MSKRDTTNPPASSTLAPLIGPLSLGLGVGAVALGAALATYAWRRYAKRAAPETKAAAFADPIDRSNLAQTRDAGWQGMRDAPGAWDRTDQASDESFPASDPPAGR